MKKQYFSILASALLMLVSISTNLNAQVSGLPEGYLVDFPQVSTAQNPIWYNMQTSNYNTTADRNNRYLFWDGTVLGTDKLDLGITFENEQDKYLWRLEQGPTTSTETTKYVYLVSKFDGKRVSSIVENATTGAITTSDLGEEFKMGTTQSAKDEGRFTNEIPVAGQFYLQYEAAATLSLLNVGAADKSFSIILFNAWPSVTKSSGWFFYPEATEPNALELTKENLFNVYPNPFNAELQINNSLIGLDKVEIFNVQGAKVLSESATPYRVNTSALTAGLYIVKAHAAGNIYTRKMLKSDLN